MLRIVERPLTPALVIELQRVLTEGTLDEPDAVGRFRRLEEDIVIEDETGTRLHTPPPANQLEQRMRDMCGFANGVGHGEFMPPAVCAILLHLWLTYDHPFVDGNGRTARALFYWSMARQGSRRALYDGFTPALSRYQLRDGEDRPDTHGRRRTT